MGGAGEGLAGSDSCVGSRGVSELAAFGAAADSVVPQVSRTAGGDAESVGGVVPCGSGDPDTASVGGAVCAPETRATKMTPDDSDKIAAQVAQLPLPSLMPQLITPNPLSLPGKSP